LKDIENDLIALGYRILAISADRPEELSKSMDKHHMTYTLLSDSSMVAASAFGIAYRVDDFTVKKYRLFGMNLESASGSKHHQLPVPSVFIAGWDGVIRFEYINPNYKVRLDGSILLEAAKVYSKN
jgi:peroxiredoxin